MFYQSFIACMKRKISTNFCYEEKLHGNNSLPMNENSAVYCFADVASPLSSHFAFVSAQNLLECLGGGREDSLIIKKNIKVKQKFVII